MAIIFIDGFDHYASSDMIKKWSSLGDIPWTISTSGGRRGGGAAVMGYAGYQLVKNLPTPVSTIITGFACYGDGTTSSSVAILLPTDAGVVQFTVLAQSDGAVCIKNSVYDYSSGSYKIIGLSSPGIILSKVWQYIEMKATISHTVGSVIIKVNGVVVINITNVDTQSTTNSSITGIAYGIRGSSGSLLDDLYISDNTGNSNNDFLGDCRIDTLYPTRDGANSQFTPSSGTAHWSLVNDITPNTTTFVSSNVVGAMDTYGFSGISGTATSIYGVQVNNAALKDDSGTRSISNLVISGGTAVQSKVMALSTSQNFYSSVHEVDPATNLPWKASAVNASEFGTVVI